MYSVDEDKDKDGGCKAKDAFATYEEIQMIILFSSTLVK